MKTRKLKYTVTITKAGEKKAFQIKLPANASRVTGIAISVNTSNHP